MKLLFRNWMLARLNRQQWGLKAFSVNTRSLLCPLSSDAMHILFVAFLSGAVPCTHLWSFGSVLKSPSLHKTASSWLVTREDDSTCFVKILVCSYVFISLQAIIYSVCRQTSYLLHAFEKWYHFFVATNSKALASAALTLNASWILSAKRTYQTVETG